MGQPIQQQMMHSQCAECEECKTEVAAFWTHLSAHKEQPLKERIELVANVANSQLGTLNILIGAVLIGCIFHKHVWDFIKSRWPVISGKKA